MGQSLFYRATQRGNVDTFDCTPRDMRRLRSLAARVAEYAADAGNAALRELWKDHGALKPTRPMVICDPENGWSEILRPECESASARVWETQLMKKLFYAEHMRDDTVVEATLDIPYTYTESDWVEGGAAEAITDAGGHGWQAMMHEDMTADDLKMPEFHVDMERTAKVIEYAETIFGGMVEVRLRGKWWHSLGLTNTLGEIRGFQNVYYDLCDQPELIHRLMEMLCRYHMERLDYLEQHGLLTRNDDRLDVPAGILGYARDLPLSAGAVTLNNLWGWFEAQELSEISPDMFREFIFPYQRRIAERFGLVSYGCCEALEGRIDTVCGLANLRRVSVSPWADAETMAEKLGNRYLYAWKLNPAWLAVYPADQQLMRNEMGRILKTLISCDCRVEMVMKDNHTLANRPQNVLDWVRIARELAENA